MKWNPEQLLEVFRSVAKLCEIEIGPDVISIEILKMPHRPPRNLPKGKMAVYVFSDKECVLKVGKAGPKSQARYKSQHYKFSAPSTLAKSLLSDEDRVRKYDLTKENVSDWIKENTDRVNFLVDANMSKWLLNLLEAFVQCRLRPTYEGHNSGHKRNLEPVS